MDEFELNDVIRSAWGWLGLEPVKIIAENDFGNLIIADVDGAFWLFCPEECSCTRIASNLSELQNVRDSPVFTEDWGMAGIIEDAAKCLRTDFGRPEIRFKGSSMSWRRLHRRQLRNRPVVRTHRIFGQHCISNKGHGRRNRHRIKSHRLFRRTILTIIFRALDIGTYSKLSAHLEN